MLITGWGGTFLNKIRLFLYAFSRLRLRELLALGFDGSGGLS